MKYYEKRHQLTFLLFLIFLCWLCAVIFSWMSKIFVLYSGVPYLVYNTGEDPNTPLSFILLRITDFRMSFLFVTVGDILSYILEVKLFEKAPDNKKYLIYTLGAFTAFYSFFIYIRGNILLDVLAFLLVALLTLIIYMPFIIRCIQSYRSVEDASFKKAFLSLAIMALCIILVFVMLLIDRVLIFLGSPGFTVFYFLAWSLVVIFVLCTYLGYIRPKSKEL